MESSVAEIREKIERHDALVVGAHEFKQMVRDGERLDEVDVITCATKAVMSGTMLVLSLKVAERNAFLRAHSVRIGGIPAHAGPCPNERLGYVDCTLHATAHTHGYGGGHLIRDLLEGRRVDVEVKTHDGTTIHTTTTLDELGHARMIGTRCAFMNYLAIVNPSKSPVRSIFSISPLQGGMAEATVAGCGELNPIQNDPDLEHIGVGTRVLYNGGEGFVMGLGTRSYPHRPNLSIVGDLKHMQARWTGGFRTSLSPEVVCTVAVPIPITDRRTLQRASVLDEHIPLMVASVLGRHILAETSYADVWQGTDLDIHVESADMTEYVAAARACPTGALSDEGVIDETRCMHCGHCTTTSGAFGAHLGHLQLGRRIPIVARLSDRLGAIAACEELKRRILDGSFELTEPVQPLKK